MLRYKLVHFLEERSEENGERMNCFKASDSCHASPFLRMHPMTMHPSRQGRSSADNFAKIIRPKIVLFETLQEIKSTKLNSQTFDLLTIQETQACTGLSCKLISLLDRERKPDAIFLSEFPPTWNCTSWMHS